MSGSTSLSTSELSVGKRIRVGDDYATILYIGEVTGTSGTWLGVEWDNGATRGKHNGDRGGVQYFTCRSPNSGSFLRPNTPGLVTGTGFDTVLLGKYIDTFQTDGVESVVLGSSNGSILVEGPRLDRVRAKFSQIERLRRISLNNHDVASPGDPQAVSKLCKSVESLDLSQTLLGNWDDIADIVRYIPKLCNLELNYNRIQFTGILNTNNFPKITHLRLNSTLMSWAEACEIAIYLPELQDLQLGYNKLRGLSPSSRASTAIALKNLIALNLDSNVITDWASTMKSCSLVPNLRSLMLPSNAIALIPRRVDAPEVGQNSLALEYLALTGNPISNWSNIDSLVSWFPRLCDLSISLESLSSVLSVSSRRHFTIARLPFLKKLNGTEVSDRERMDAELFYLSWISQHEQGKDIEASHPRWKDLTTKYDRSTEIARDAVEKLGNHMISVTVSKVHGSIAQHKAVSIDGNRTALRVLPTMTTKTFGMKLRKVLKLPSSVDPESLWLLSSSNTNEAIALRCFDVDPLRDLSWSGVEDGSIIGLVQS